MPTRRGWTRWSAWYERWTGPRRRLLLRLGLLQLRGNRVQRGELQLERSRRHLRGGLVRSRRGVALRARGERAHPRAPPARLHQELALAGERHLGGDVPLGRRRGLLRGLLALGLDLGPAL